MPDMIISHHFYSFKKLSTAFLFNYKSVNLIDQFFYIMSDKDIAKLTELANTRLERARAMSKKEAILSLNEAGILTKTGKFMHAYVELEQVVNK
jgi:hypothetical protein